MTKQLDPAILAGFTGTEQWYRHALVHNVTFTDGIKYVAESAGAWWLVDDIALVQMLGPNLRKHPFQSWTLTRDKTGHAANLVCEDGNGVQLYQKRIDITDFPRMSFTMWVADGVILLPSEY